MEHRGVPIDMEIFPQLADNDTWRAVRDAMVPAIDAQYGVYVRDRRRRLAFQHGALRRLSRARGHYGWPLLETGKLNMRRKTFEDMAKGCPQLEALRQLRHARDKMRKIKLAVGADGRNRTVLWPFKAKTGPHAAESLAVDLLAGGMAALADQAGAGHGVAYDQAMMMSNRRRVASPICSGTCCRCSTLAISPCRAMIG